MWEPIHTGPGSAARRRDQVRAALADASVDVLVDEVATADHEGVLSGHGAKAAPAVAVDVDAVASYVKRAPAMPRDELVPIGAGATGEALEGLFARRNLRKLLKLVVQRARNVEDPRAAAIYGVAAEVLSTADDDTLTEVCVQPEITSWLAVAEERPDPGGPVSEDDLADPLALAMLPELSEADYRVGIRAAKDTGHGVTLRRLGLTLFGYSDALHLLVGGGSCDRVSAGKLSPIDPRSIDAMPLPTFGARTVLAPWPTAWLARTMPPNEESHTAQLPEFFAFVDAVASGLAVLEDAWPEAREEVLRRIRWLLPLPLVDQQPHNYSVHGVRGCIVSSPRRDHRMAQTLVHEAAHNRFSTILDLASVCANPTEGVTSPIVDAPRPLYAVFHGVFAFAQDIMLTRKLLDRGYGEEDSLQAYLEIQERKVREGLAVLRRHARPTEVGAQVIDETTRILDDRAAAAT
jgi:HEXXH motif-containing protein